jgi:lipopolysaccharide transport system ATP-binding protein
VPQNSPIQISEIKTQNPSVQRLSPDAVTEDWVIRARNLSKKYFLWRDPSARLIHPILDHLADWVPSGLSRELRVRQRKLCTEFFALRDVSLEVKKGESIGIIGRNGSGKSTLLQLIAGTLQTTSGTVETRGKVAALLELGSGFSPDFTGRENVFLNAALLGLTRHQTEERFDRIASFADIGDFIDQPVKTYSSGMLVRLAFSVAVQVDAEVLIVDEALAVGDIFFQQKCYRKIRQILETGVTFLFVSHDYGAMKNLCERGILLQQGKKVFEGPAEQCAHRYMREAYAPATASATSGVNQDDTTAAKKTDPNQHRVVPKESRNAVLNSNVLGSAKARHGERVLEFLGASLSDVSDRPITQIGMRDTAILRLLIRINQEIDEPEVAIRLVDRLANTVFSSCNHCHELDLGHFAPFDEFLMTFRIGFCVEPGPYTLTLETGKLSQTQPNMGSYFDVIEGVGPITVYDPRPTEVRPFYGMAELPCEIEVS